MLTFVGGALLSVGRRYVPLSWMLGAAAAVAWVTLGPSSDEVLRNATWAVCLPYLVVLLAYRLPRGARAVVRPGDASYGMYLSAYVIQQSLVAVAGPIGPSELFTATLPITYAYGLLSWRLIEAPALRLRRRLDVRSAAPQKAAVLA